jgi:hypothetical protein
MIPLSKLDTIEQARKQLRIMCPDLPWHIVGQASEVIVEAYPNAEGDTLKNLILEESVRFWTSGIACC